MNGMLESWKKIRLHKSKVETRPISIYLGGMLYVFVNSQSCNLDYSNYVYN